jgi:hypothetical protein
MKPKPYCTRSKSERTLLQFFVISLAGVACLVFTSLISAQSSCEPPLEFAYFCFDTECTVTGEVDLPCSASPQEVTLTTDPLGRTLSSAVTFRGGRLGINTYPSFTESYYTTSHTTPPGSTTSCPTSLPSTIEILFSNPVSYAEFSFTSTPPEIIYRVTTNLGQVKETSLQTTFSPLVAFSGPGITNITITPLNVERWEYSIGQVKFRPLASTTPVVGTLIINPSSGIPGTEVAINGNGWVAGPNSSEYRLFFDTSLIATQDAGSSCSTAQPNFVVNVPCEASVGNHSFVFQLVDKVTQQVLITNKLFFTVVQAIAPAVLACRGITSVTFEPINDTKRAIQSELGANPDFAGGGKKIFPDKKSINDSLNRKTVKVVAHTSFAPGTKITFRAFDVDDPTTDNTIVDDSGPLGRDNRVEGSDKPEGKLDKDPTSNTTSGCSQADGTCWAQTDATGVARVEFAVNMHPGNNYRVGASSDETYLLGAAADVGSTKVIGPDGELLPDTTAGLAKAKSTDLLTVWRRLHIEVDTMNAVTGNRVIGTVNSAVPGDITTILDLGLILDPLRFENGTINIEGSGAYSVISAIDNKIVIFGKVQDQDAKGKTFVLVDDDDYNENNTGALNGDENELITALPTTFSLMQNSDDPAKNVFATAFIQPVLDGGESISNNETNIDFALNVSDVPNATTVLGQLNNGRNPGIKELNDYWVTYIQIGYQGDLRFDNDPQSESDRDAVTYVTEIADSVKTANNGSIAVPEGGYGSLIYMEVIKDGNIQNPDRLLKTTTVPHELGHQFGLKGDLANFGIMTSGVAPDSITFTPSHLNMLRWRVKSPGQ